MLDQVMQRAHVRFFLVIICSLFASSCDDSPPHEVSIYRILASPEDYLGYRFSVQGYLGGNRNGQLVSGLYTSKGDALHHNSLSALHIDLADKGRERNIYDSCGWNFVVIKGLFHKTDLGFRFTEIEQVTRVEGNEETFNLNICYEG